MPTHRDYPWEQDERARRQRHAPRPTATAGPPPGRGHRAVPLALVAVVVAIVAAIGLSAGSAATAPAIAEPSARVLELQSRWAPGGELEVWGRSDAPDGRTVTVRAVDGSAAWTAPVRAGAFYVRTPVARRDDLRLEAAVTG